MLLADLFYLVTFISVLVTRLTVFIFEKPSPTIKGFRLHHWMYGLAGVVILFLLSGIFTNVYLLGICVGIFIDEIGYIIIKGKTHEDNYSPKSFMIIMAFLILLFIFRENIVNIYLSYGISLLNN